MLEIMAQQTQMSRVMERWPEFLASFPTVQALAAAPLDAVLQAWRGMGYYRRARHLHAAAVEITKRFDGRVPERIEELLTLPGVGRYTAGAIASMAYGHAAPIVDGNVARVLLRVRGVEAAATDRTVQAQLWAEARNLVEAAANPGVFNEALMELGATVCLPAPASPKCALCPWRDACVARVQGKQASIPRPKAAARQRVLHATSLVVVRASDGAVLLQKRGDAGMWAGLWQPPTAESETGEVPASSIVKAIGLSAKLSKPIAEFEFHATHRQVRFRVFKASVPASSRALGKLARTGLENGLQCGLESGLQCGLEWVSLADLGRRAMSNAHRRVIELALATTAVRKPAKPHVRRATIARSG